MRFGLALPHYDDSLAGRAVSWEGVLEAARAAERAGFDSVWVSDHMFLDWSKYGGPSEPRGSLECWTTLSALAADTERLRLGSLTLCNDFRSPALLAKMVATLDQLSGGRVDVGLGAGWYEPEYAAAGIPFDRPARRIDRLAEAATILARLLEGEELTLDGEHYSIKGAICRPRPLQDPRPPIWIGGKGDRLLRTVARAADGWNFSWIGSLDTYRERLDAAGRIFEEEGRDLASLRRSLGVYVLAGKDRADLDARYERLTARTPAGVLTGSNGGSAVSLDEFGASRIVGSVAEVVDRLGEVAALGVEEVILTIGALPFQLSDLEDIELVGTEIVPALR
ncbi:MAG: LLM class flavin-dependent oxidoreductase [Actinomycetota bacterium]